MNKHIDAVGNPVTIGDWEPMKMTIEELEKMQPCSDGLAFVRKCGSLEEAWKQCKNPSWLFWFLRCKSLITKPQAVEIAIACAERVLSIYEKKHPDDKRPRQAIEAARKQLKEPTEENRRAANVAAYAAANAASDYAAAYAADAAAAYAAAAFAAYAADASMAAAYAAYAMYAASAAMYAYAAAADRKKEKLWQCDKIRSVIGNPFK